MLNRRIALINLNERKVEVEDLDEHIFREHPGGLFFNLYLHEKYSSLSPVIIGSSPLTGTPLPASSSVILTGISPLSRKISHLPIMWHIGSEMKFSGFDYIVIGGKSDKPCFLWFHDELAEILEGTEISELNVKDTVDFIRKELGDDSIQIITNGPAGRKKSPVAMLSENYWGSKDSLGFGSLFGEKNIIACAFRGLGTFSCNKELYDKFLKLRKEVDNVTAPEPNILKLLKNCNAPDDLLSLVTTHLHRNNSCFNCGFSCYGYVKFREDAKVLKSTDVESPGINLNSPLSAVLLYKKSRDQFFEVYESALLNGIEPGLISLISDNEITDPDGLEKISAQLSAGQDISQKISNSLSLINPAIKKIYEKGIFPFTLYLNNMPEEEWGKNIALSFMSGVCPVFLIEKKVKIHTIEELLKKTIGDEQLNLEVKISDFIKKSYHE